MKFWMGILFAAALFAASGASAEDQPVKVMVLGTYHMANPGRDLHNMDVDDVTAPEKQRQLEEVARKLRAFGPSKVALEGLATTDDYVSSKYPEFTPADLKTNRRESVQIGYRLAYDAGHKNIFLIDETSDEIDYFPYPKVAQYAEMKGETAALDVLNAKVAEMMEAFNAQQSEKTVAELLAQMNDPQKITDEHNRIYYGLLQFGDRQSQPGAELNAYWYMRNAKIFSKLMQISEPGDRIVVVFGGGHAYWLRHFIQSTPGFELIEPNDYLR